MTLTRSRRSRWTVPLLALAALALASVTVLVITLVATRPPIDPDGQTVLDPSAIPANVADPDTAAVELGMRFSSSEDGMVDAIRFYKGPANTGVHTGSLWTDSGTLLASTRFEDETASGWQSSRLPHPIRIRAGESYVVSYHAPEGRYSADPHGFDSEHTRGDLTALPGAGVYVYGSGFPHLNHQNSNYFVDISFVRTAADPSSESPRPEQDPATSAPPATSPDQGLPLPRIPWEGGPEYWKQFPKADAAGWDEPTFFPILAWFNGISSNEEAQFDKSLGINTYSGMWEGTPYHFFENNDVFWIGGPLNDTFDSDSPNWVGNFLDDEVDGRFTPEEGRAHLKQVLDGNTGDGRFNYANYTQMVMGTDLPAADAEAYVNDFTDVVSIDMYWYTIPYCDLGPYRDVYITPVKQANCRTASSYGKTMNSLRTRDAADGKLQPLWQWVENLNGGPGEGPFTANITAGQVKGAVMNSLINEARGIAYFNQSFTGPCQGSAVFRQAQVTKDFCGKAQVDAVKTINGQIAQLAPVLNTQSYEYSFGDGLDTMLKVHEGDAYVFAMVDGESRPGARTFTVPPGVSGETVEVLFEDRAIPVDKTGRFTDTFDEEYSYHVYRISQ